MQLREAADILGVHYQTAYQWIRQGSLPARKQGRGYEVDEAAVRALASRRQAGQVPARAIEVRDWHAQVDQLYAAIAAGEETRARNWIARLAAGVTVTDLCARVIAPALSRIGDDWAAGRVTIAQEHRASAICERLIAVRAAQPAGRPRGCAVVATPPGERHGLSALMAAACLREDRWLVHHLAADLPVTEVIQCAHDVSADLVVFSAATEAGALAAVAAAAEVTAANPRMLVLAGGPGDSAPELIGMAREGMTSRRMAGQQPAPVRASYASGAIAEGSDAAGL